MAKRASDTDRDTVSALDLMVDQIASLVTGKPPPHRRARRVPMRYESHHGVEAALDWATGRDLPKIVCDWKEGPIATLAVLSGILEWVRPVKLPAVPSLTFGGVPPVEQLVPKINLYGTLDPNWKVVELDSGSDELIFCLCPADLDVADALQRYEAWYARKENANERRRARRAARCEGR